MNAEVFSPVRTTDQSPIVEQPHFVEMINLLELSPEQATKLKTDIAGCANAVQLWVHTHYDEGDAVLNQNELNQYIDRRNNMITSSMMNRLPTIALIGSNSKHDDDNGTTFLRYKNYYQSHLKSDNGKPIYWVPTMFDTSTPSISALPEPDFDSYEYVQYNSNNWDSFCGILNGLGVRTIIIRGRNLSYTRYSLTSLTDEQKQFVQKHSSIETINGVEYINVFDRCVGHAFNSLGLRGFDVRLSQVVYKSP